jgi:lipoprotein
MKKVCFLFLLFPLLLGSCVTGSYGLAREVRLGMTEAQVIHLLGAPQAREETPDSAKWGYHWEQPLGNKVRNMELKFRDGRVVNFLLSEVPVSGRTGFEAGSRRSREEVSEDAYTDILLELKSAGSDGKRLKVLDRSLRQLQLSGRQARGLLRQFSFDSERLKALSIIAPNLSLNYDKDLLIDTFTFSSNAAAARTLLEALH